METSRDDFVIAIRSAFLKKGTQQRFSLLTLILVSLIFLVLGSLNFKIIDGLSKNFSYENLDNYLIISSKDESIKKDQVIISNYPIKLKKLIEIINVNFLKKNYTSQSSIKISNYILDLNSRTLNSNKSKLDLTEMEANLILFLKNSSQPTNIKRLQKEVWGHVPNLETHTVETHIYRLRKKIKEKFEDDYFINSSKNGYEIK